MIATDEDALICDFAETYHILDYKELPAVLAGTLASGLRGQSRIKMELSNTPVSLDTMISAATADYAANILWVVGRHCRGKQPESLLKALMPSLTPKSEKKEKPTAFSSPEAFKRKWEQIQGDD